MTAYSSRPIERTIIGGFLSVILTGALLLYLGSINSTQPMSLVDSLFTSTSAVCVTGLAVVDTGQMPFFCQVVLLLLIQLGGLGIMTAVSFAFVLVGGRVNHYQRLLFTSSIGVSVQSGAVRLVQLVVALALGFELLGLIPLYIGFRTFMPPGQALWFGVFHSISAFCNAGFSLFTNNLDGFGAVPTVWITISALIVFGGLGFLVWLDIFRRISGRRHRLSTHSVIVLVTTAVLIVFGTLTIFYGQWDLGQGIKHNLAHLPNSIFLSISARTAGFNITPMSTLKPFSIMILFLLMIIGASPGSTGGGMKTTTWATLALTATAQARNKKQIIVRRTEISNSTVHEAVAVFAFYSTSLMFGAILLTAIEPFSLQKIVFDVISALGTVGLSLQSTAAYSTAGKLVICLLMFWGRVGLLTFIWSISRTQDRESDVRYPEESIPVG